MIVTSIVPFDKSRNRIYIDGELAFVLYKGEMREYNIREDEMLSQQAYDRIMTETLPKRAKLRGMALLTKKPYTEKLLRDKYERSEYPGNIIDDAIDYLKSFNYINDVQYSLDYIYTYRNSRSITRIKNDLIGKGVKKQDIVEAINQTALSEDGLPNEIEQIKEILRKKRYNPDDATWEESRKMAASLMRKGYCTDKIRKCIKSSFDEY